MPREMTTAIFASSLHFHVVCPDLTVYLMLAVLGNDGSTYTLPKVEAQSPMSKYATPQKARVEIATLKDEVDDLRHQLREESARKKAVLKDIELQTRQLQASEARLKVMATKLNELAQSKHELASKKAASDKELLQLKAKWDSAARKLDKIHEAVARTSAQIVVANKEKATAEARVIQLTVELATKKDAETQCIELSDKLALATRQVEQLQRELSGTKEAYTATERTSEETQNQLYTLATTVSQLRADLDAEMNYSTQRKTELAVLQVEKRRLEELLSTTQFDHESSTQTLQGECDEHVKRAEGLKANLEALTHEFEAHRHQQAAQIVQLESDLQNLQEQLAHKESADEEQAHHIQQLEQELQGHENQREALTNEVQALQEDLKARQEETRRMDERVNFLESAMDFVRGELKEKTDELDELKSVNAALHQSLTQHKSDMASVHAAQQQLAHSLLVANERIQALEASLAAAEGSALDASALRIELDQVQKSAEAAQQTAKEDLETIRVELEAETARLAESHATLEHRTKAHDALQAAHETLQTAHANMQRDLEDRFDQLAQSRTEQHELVEHNQSLSAQRTALEEQLSGLAKELQSSQSAVLEQASLVDKLKQEVDELTATTNTAADKIERLEAQLNASTLALNELTSERDLLTMTVSTLEHTASSLNTEVDALRETHAQLAASLQSAQDEKAALIENGEANLKATQEAASTTISTLKSELSTALESAMGLVADNTDLAAENSSVKTQIASLQQQVSEHSALEARHLESQRASVNQISELRSELKVRSDAVDAAQQDLEKQIRIMEECHQGRLAAQAAQFERRIQEIEANRDSEIERVSALARSEADASQATHYKQMESLHISLNELKQALTDSQLEAQQSKVELGALQQSSQELSAQLEASNALSLALRDTVTQSEAAISSMKSEIETFQAEALAAQQSSQELSANVATSSALISQLQDESTKLTSELTSTNAELVETRNTIKSLQASFDASSSQLTSANELIKQLQVEKHQSEADFVGLQSELDETKKRLAELEQVSASVATQLSNASDLVSDLQVEKKHAETGMVSLKKELGRYQEQLSETDAALASLQSENDTLKAELSRMKKSWDSQVAQVQTEKKKWMELAESQAKDADSLTADLTASQEEVAAWKSHYEALRVKRDQEERDANDLRVKRMNHELNMANAELTRQKSRVHTREAAIAAGKAREEKLQTNLDAQIEKCRDLQRQLSDRDREVIIAAGRARSTSKPERPAPSNPAPTETLPSLDEIHEMGVHLSDAKAEMARLEKQLEVEKAHVEHLITEQTKLTGHNNPKQKIQFTHKLMKENHELKLERASLLAQLEKRGVDSPHRKSLTRIARPRQTALAMVAAGKTVSASEVPLSEVFKAAATAASTTENVPNVQQ